jgi:hypothetical protein
MPERFLIDWQPIETARRDGTPVLVTVLEKIQLPGFEWLQAVFGENVTIAAWLGSQGSAEIGWITVATALALVAGLRPERGVRVTPTHWMPLPAPARPAARLVRASEPAIAGALAGLALSTRARNALAHQGFRSRADLRRLAKLSDGEILLWPKVGPSVLMEIRQAAALAAAEDRTVVAEAERVRR